MHTYIHTLHYITLHYITLHYITLHYITSHHITLHYITYIQTNKQTNKHTYIHTYIHTSCIYIYIYTICIFNVTKSYSILLYDITYNMYVVAPAEELQGLPEAHPAHAAVHPHLPEDQRHL